MAVTQSQAQPRSSPSQRSRPSPRSSPRPSNPSPTRKIEIGREHLAISGAILRLAKRRAAAAGIDLDIGTIPSYTGADATPDDPERPVRIVAHGIARAADRFPYLRKLSRQVEGTEGKAGLGADIAAASYEIFVRNQEALESAARDMLRAAAQKKPPRHKRGQSQPEVPSE